MRTFSRTKKTHRSGSECRGHQNEDVGGGARHTVLQKETECSSDLDGLVRGRDAGSQIPLEVFPLVIHSTFSLTALNPVTGRICGLGLSRFHKRNYFSFYLLPSFPPSLTPSLLSPFTLSSFLSFLSF